MLLIANYNEVIKPRGDLLKDRVNYFSLEEAFFHPDDSFCKHWGIDPKDLKEAKKARKRFNTEEREVLWSYVDAL